MPIFESSLGVLVPPNLPFKVLRKFGNSYSTIYFIHTVHCYIIRRAFL